MADRERVALPAVEALILDMDGVVTDTARVHAGAWKELFDGYLARRAGRTGESFVRFDKASDYLSFVDGRNRYDGVAAFLHSRGIELPRGDPGDPPGTDTVCGLGNGKDELFRRSLAEHGASAYPSTVALLRALRARGVRTGLVTASRNAADVLGAAGVGDLFDVRVDGVDAADRHLAGKPDPAMFLEAARRLGVAPERAGVVEDALAGVAAGRAGGFAVVVGVDRHGLGDALRRAGADVVVGDLGDLETHDGEPVRP